MTAEAGLGGAAIGYLRRLIEAEIVAQKIDYGSAQCAEPRLGSSGRHSMSSVPRVKISEEEYLRREVLSLEKHEYYRGEVFLMAGGSPRHNVIIDNLVAALLTQLRGTGCRPFSSNQRVKIVSSGLTTYPDVFVVCGPWNLDEVDNQAITNPRVIIEILSPSTEQYDRGAKFELYQQLPSLREYLLIAQSEPSIDQFVRQTDTSWLPHSLRGLSVELKFSSIAATLRMADIYQDVEFDDLTKVNA